MKNNMFRLEYFVVIYFNVLLLTNCNIISTNILAILI